MSSKLERFTRHARQVLAFAQEEAERMRHGHIGTEHLLLGLMHEGGGVAGRVLRELGLELSRVREIVRRQTSAATATEPTGMDLSPDTRMALGFAVDEARRMGHHYIGTEHLLLGLVRQDKGVAMDVLRKLETSAEQIRRHTRRVLEESPRATAEPRESAAPHVRTYSLALLGFGNVGRALADLLKSKRDELREKYGIEWRITGVASRRMGWLSNPDGFDVEALLAGNYQSPIAASTLQDWLKASRADVLFENSSMNPHTGQPAIDYIRTALELGVHTVTANKGPVVYAYHELRDLAMAKGKRFLFEATVMGGAPIFSLFREALPATNLRRFRGLLNSTTNLIITEMENGLSFDQAVKKAQDLGIAETDPSFDVDGWDATVKVSALATVLMGAPLKPQDIQREGIRGLTPEKVQAARAEGRPFKLVCQAERMDDGRVTASVRPEQVPLDDPLASVRGATSIIQFQMDTLYGLTLSEQDPDALTTAYGPLADFITIAQSETQSG